MIRKQKTSEVTGFVFVLYFLLQYVWHCQKNKTCFENQTSVFRAFETASVKCRKHIRKDPSKEFRPPLWTWKAISKSNQNKYEKPFYEPKFLFKANGFGGIYATLSFQTWARSQQLSKTFSGDSQLCPSAYSCTKQIFKCALVWSCSYITDLSKKCVVGT